MDNNSTDDTKDVSLQFGETLPLRYYFEPTQGLSRARNRALKECRGDLLVFTDDDVVVDEQWLAEYARCRETFPDADFFGGRVKPQWSEHPPRWLKDEAMPLLSGLLVNYDLGRLSRTLGASHPLPFGASFAISRKLFQKVGSFRSDLGVKGAVPGRGEEADYLERACREGFRGAYLADSVCYHPVNQERLAIGYMYRYGIQKGIAEARMERLSANAATRSEFGYAIRGLLQLLRGRGDRLRQCVINMGIQRGLRRERKRNRYV